MVVLVKLLSFRVLVCRLDNERLFSFHQAIFAKMLLRRRTVITTPALLPSTIRQSCYHHDRSSLLSVCLSSICQSSTPTGARVRYSPDLSGSQIPIIRQRRSRPVRHIEMAASHTSLQAPRSGRVSWQPRSGSLDSLTARQGPMSASVLLGSVHPFAPTGQRAVSTRPSIESPCPCR